jgi:uncharacterized protein (TIGR00369 family)
VTGAGDELADWFRRHWSDEIPFNRHTGMVVREWGPDGVEIELPYDDALSAHEGIFHGGMLAALIDTTGTGAVMAGHDYRKGSRVSTVSMTVGRLHHADVIVRAASGTLLARGSVVVSISGKRAGAPDLPPA